MSDKSEFRLARDGTLVHEPGNTLERIDQVWLVVSTDDDGEGVVSYPMMQGFGPMPLMAADPERLASVVLLAEKLAKGTGMKMKLIKLSTREEVRTF